LAEYTINSDLCDLVENEIEKSGLQFKSLIGIFSGGNNAQMPPILEIPQFPKPVNHRMFLLSLYEI
jgi:hypothetical protein